MHDIDRVLFEVTGETFGEEETYGEEEVFGEEETYETLGEVFGEEETYETAGDREVYETYGEEEVFGEGMSQEIALASELLEVTTEEELDRFLGNVLRSAVSAASSFARSDAGKAVGGILKSAARKALPHIGKAVGDYIAPGSGGAVGQRVGNWLGKQFELGLQTEGLSAEDREYQTARTFVRFATDAARRTAQSPTSVPAAAAAQRAAVTAARKYLPGLTRPGGGRPGARRKSGRWVRRGNNIVILGA
jgi:hypothetical protein